MSKFLRLVDSGFYMNNAILVKDSGIGCPIGGVLIGVYDINSGKILTDEVNVKYFQNPLFKIEAHYTAISDAIVTLVDKVDGNQKQPVSISWSTYSQQVEDDLTSLGYQVNYNVSGNLEPAARELRDTLGQKHRDYKLGLGYPKELSDILDELDGKSRTMMLSKRELAITKRKQTSKILSEWAREDSSRISVFKTHGANMLYVDPWDSPEYIKAVMALSTSKINRRRERKSWYKQMVAQGKL